MTPLATWGSIDPGVHELACAEWRGDRLHDAYFVNVTEAWRRPRAWALTVIEKPQWDARSVNGATLIDLAWSGGIGAGAAGAPITAYEVREWKGSARKPQHHRRGWCALLGPEKAVLGGDATIALIEDACTRGGRDGWTKPGVAYYGRGKAAKVHNLLDAVLLGLFHLGRIDVHGAPRVR